jgi:TrmH family RNA methyltransferase
MDMSKYKLLRRASSRHNRRKHNLVLCEGIRVCREALAHCPNRVHMVVFSDEFDVENAAAKSAILPQNTAWVEVPAAEFAKFAETENPQGVLAVLERPEELELGVLDDSFVLVLDRLQDPGNAGTILRTAWAAGLRTVVATSGTVDLFSPKTLRAGMGAQFSMNIHALGKLCEVRNRLATLGFPRMWESVPTGGVNCYSEEFDLRKSALVVGNEANGSALLPDSDRVTIPMPGAAESLNAAQAATILIFEAVRRGLCRK